MGLGAAGVLDWQTAVAFSLGADLGTTITSWMASLNLSKNAKRAAYAHISLQHHRRGGDAAAVLRLDGAAGLGHGLVRRRSGRGGDRQRQGDLPARAGRGRPLFDRLQHLQHGAAVPLHRRVRPRAVAGRAHERPTTTKTIRSRAISIRSARKDIATGVPAVQQESGRYLEGAAQFLAIARGNAEARPTTSQEHYAALDVLSREIRNYTAAMFEPEHAVRPGRPGGEPDRGGGLDREPRRDALSRSRAASSASPSRRPAGSWSTPRSTRSPMRCGRSRRPTAGHPARSSAEAEPRLPAIATLRERCLKLGAELPWAERGAILTLLGSAERAFYPDRAHRCRAPLGVARRAGRRDRSRASARRRWAAAAVPA